VLGDTTASIVLFLALDRLFPDATARRMAIKKRFYE
jgi:hypothetical protein